MLRFLACAFALLAGTAAVPAHAQTPSLAAAILPASRSVQVHQRGTVFATLINTGQAVATGCRPVAVTPLPIAFTYQAADGTNQPVGSPALPVQIPAGAAQAFVLTITPTEAFAPTNLRIDFVCDNAGPAPAYLGVNSLLLSAEHQPTPDIVAMAVTASGDGILTLHGGQGSFAVATVNLGSPGQIAVSADTGTPGLPLTATVCQTRPESGECMAPPAPLVSVAIGSSATPTFGVFAQASSAIGDDPAGNRIHVRFVDATGASRGATSVSVRSDATAPAGEPNQWHVLGGGPLRGAIPRDLPADIWGFNDSSSITSAWNSGCFDVKRSRMYVLGGGHADGAYNGVFAYNAIAQSWERFTEPSLAYPKLGEPSASVYPDGTPAAVHTYGMVQCLGDELLVASGSRWWTGGGGVYAWLLNLDTRTWRRLDFPPALGYSGAWDPVARRAIVRDQSFSYFAFDPATGAIERPWRQDDAGSYDGHTSAFDTARRLVLTIGRGVNGTGGALLLAVDGREAARPVQFTGATEILRAEAPGLDYDERRQLFVAWMGGRDLFEIDVARLQIVRVAAGGPAPPAQEPNGTFNRFRYLRATGNFMLVNRVDDPVYLLVPPASATPPPAPGSGPDPVPPSAPADTSASDSGEDELTTPHIERVVRLLVAQHIDYGEMRIQDGRGHGPRDRIRLAGRRGSP